MCVFGGRGSYVRRICRAWVVVVAQASFSICQLFLRLRFPTNRILLWLAQKGSAGVGGEASSHVAQSVVYVICWFHLCIGFPTNRILFCVGSKRVCRVWVGRSKTLYYRSKSLLEPAGRSRTRCRHSKSLLGPARIRVCARNHSSDLSQSPHASGLWPTCSYM